METIEYRTVDKSTWGDGPWQDEPDKVQYPDETTGLPCVITRTSHNGNLCGYVGVPPGHPLYGKDYGNVDLSAHGGITFSDACMTDMPEDRGVCHIPAPGEPDHVWWFGFDCAHAWDFLPGMAARRELSHLFTDFDCKYRDLSYVKAQIASLAQQLKALES